MGKHLGLSFGAGKANEAVQTQFPVSGFKRTRLFPLTDDDAAKGDSLLLQNSAGLQKVWKALFGHQPANGKDEILFSWQFRLIIEKLQIDAIV